MSTKVAYAAFLLMLLASISAIALRPTHKLAMEQEKLLLEQVVPKQFLDWKITEMAAPLVNP